MYMYSVCTQCTVANNRLYQINAVVLTLYSFTDAHLIFFQLEDLIREKLLTRINGLRQSFRSNDPMGKGNVSRYWTVFHLLVCILFAIKFSCIMLDTFFLNLQGSTCDNSVSSVWLSYI